MFKNLNEKDKKKIYSLLSLGIVCVIALIIISCIPSDKKTNTDKDAAKLTSKRNLNK